jgi:flagellar motility protein MotE (MotC chaperone)
MIDFIRELRLVPIALVACACLLALKTADFILDDGYGATSDSALVDADTAVVRTTPDVVQHSGAALSWARQMFNFPDGNGPAPAPAIAPQHAKITDPDITGSVTTDAPAPPGKSGDKSAAKTEMEAKSGPAAPPGKNGKDPKSPGGTVIPVDGPGQVSGAERAILERLQERRQELDARANELDIRESLIKAAEKRMDAKLAELKEVEGKIVVETQQKDDAQNARLKGLVTMYENMKAREAAKIFDRLDVGVLLQVASLVNPRQMAEILAQMSPDMAQRLTVELASKAQQAKPDSTNELPKIDGQPTAR